MLSKMSGKYYRDITERELEKCTTDCGVFKGIKCVNEMLDFVSEFKGQPK